MRAETLTSTCDTVLVTETQAVEKRKQDAVIYSKSSSPRTSAVSVIDDAIKYLLV